MKKLFIFSLMVVNSFFSMQAMLSESERQEIEIISLRRRGLALELNEASNIDNSNERRVHLASIIADAKELHDDAKRHQMHGMAEPKRTASLKRKAEAILKKEIVSFGIRPAARRKLFFDDVNEGNANAVNMENNTDEDSSSELTDIEDSE
jgi:hypothetical protein